MREFIRVFTVCQRTCYPATRTKWLSFAFLYICIMYLTRFPNPPSVRVCMRACVCARARARARVCVCVCLCVCVCESVYAYIPPSHLSHILNAMLIVSYVSSFFLLYLNLYLLTDSYPLDTTIYNFKQNRIPQLHPAWPPCFVLCIFLQFLRSSI